MEQLTYFFITRKLFESAIWREDPHVLKLFIYLIGMARHYKKPKHFSGFKICRGEMVTSLSRIAEDNEYLGNNVVKQWSRAKVSRMLHLLENNGYIKLLSDTFGTHVRVCNYNRYQSRETYESDSGETAVKQRRNSGETAVRTYNNDNNDNNVKNDKEYSSNKFKQNSVPVLLSNMLLSFINSRNGNFKKPDIQKWATEVDRMIRIDKRNPCGIMNIICWSQSDEFWQNNILSTGKLRKQYDQLRMRMLSISNIPKGKRKQLKNAVVSREWLENGK